MYKTLAALGLGLTLVGCNDPATTAKIEALENRIAELEKAGPPAAAPGARQAPQVDQEAEKKAGELYKEAAQASNKGDVDKAKELLETIKKDYPDTRVAKVAGRLEGELAIIGKPAGDLAVEKWFQGDTSFADGKATLVVFWEVWCPHCKREVPKLQATYDKFKGQGLNMVGLTKLTRNVTEDQVKEFIASNNVGYPIAKEEGQNVSNTFQVSGIPAAAVVKDGKIAWRGHPARLTDQMIEDWLK